MASSTANNPPATGRLAAIPWVVIAAVLGVSCACRAENYVILFSGGGEPAGNYPRYYDNTIRMHRLVTGTLNCKPDNVWVLFADGTDPGADQPAGVDSDWSGAVSSGSAVLPATAANLRDALSALPAGPEDLVFLWAFDHGQGTLDRPDIVGEETLVAWYDSIRDDDLAAWAAALNAGRQAYVFGQCFAGGMLDDLDIATGSGRFGCAACNHYESSYFDTFVGALADGLETEGHTTTHDLYRYAYENNPYATDGEGPGGDYAEFVEHPWQVGDDLDLAVANWVGLGAGGTSELWNHPDNWAWQPTADRTVRVEFAAAGTVLVNSGNRHAGYLSVDYSTEVGPAGCVKIDRGGGLSSVCQVIGDVAYGRVLHETGTNEVAEMLTLGRQPGAQGRYDLAGGSLLTNDLYVGKDGTGTFTQTGGTNTVGGAIYLGFGAGSSGTYTISAGTLEVPELHVGGDGAGTLDLADPGAHVTVSRLLRLGPEATFSAGAGSAIHMTGAALANESTVPSRLSGLEQLTLIFEGGPECLSRLEVAGQDLGPLPAGWEENFVIGTLQVGAAASGRIELADLFDNQPASTGAEALYVSDLLLGAGARIYPNDLILYYLNGGAPKRFFEGDANLDGAVGYLDLGALAGSYGQTEALWSGGDFNGDRVVNHLDLGVLATNYGKLTGGPPPVPAPAAAVLLAAGTLALLRRRRR